MRKREGVGAQPHNKSAQFSIGSWRYCHSPEDLLAEATRRQEQGVAFAGVVFAHQLRVTIGMCVRDLELIATASNPEDLANRVESRALLNTDRVQ
jgi:hypothetical protein